MNRGRVKRVSRAALFFVVLVLTSVNLTGCAALAALGPILSSLGSIAGIAGSVVGIFNPAAGQAISNAGTGLTQAGGAAQSFASQNTATVPTTPAPSANGQATTPVGKAPSTNSEDSVAAPSPTNPNPTNQPGPWKSGYVFPTGTQNPDTKNSQKPPTVVTPPPADTTDPFKKADNPQPTQLGKPLITAHGVPLPNHPDMRQPQLTPLEDVFQPILPDPVFKSINWNAAREPVQTGR